MSLSKTWRDAGLLAVAAAGIALLTTGAAAQNLLINELYFDSPGGTDSLYEYIELRGTPGMSLDNMYLIFVEAEGLGVDGSAGMVENVYDLNGYTLPADGNGYLAIPRVGYPYAVNPDAVVGIPNFEVIENSGFTALTIRANAVTPFVGLDIDQGNDGLDAIGEDQLGWRSDWEIMDSIGIFSEPDELSDARLYGAINFGPGPSSNVEGPYVDVGFEIEYAGRWGNSTGQTADDWHISNLTDNPASGFDPTYQSGDFRQSGDPHGIGAPGQFVESNQGVPYGANLTDTVGGPNYILGDATGDGQVTGADYTVWADNFGLTDPNAIKDLSRFVGDFNNDGAVSGADYTIWADYFGQGGAPLSPAIQAVPEPSSLALALVLGLALSGLLSRR